MCSEYIENVFGSLLTTEIKDIMPMQFSTIKRQNSLVVSSEYLYFTQQFHHAEKKEKSQIEVRTRSRQTGKRKVCLYLERKENDFQ